MTITTEKSIKLKDGSTLPAGLAVEFIPDQPQRCRVVCVQRERPALVRIVSAFNPPDLTELQEAIDDGVCPSIAGQSVEPDGWDAGGAPSWLLALGMI